MDASLEKRLKELSTKGSQIAAIETSIAEKKQLIENLQNTAAKTRGLPDVVRLAKMTIASLEKEIEQEKAEIEILRDAL